MKTLENERFNLGHLGERSTKQLIYEETDVKSKEFSLQPYVKARKGFGACGFDVELVSELRNGSFDSATHLETVAASMIGDKPDGDKSEVQDAKT